VHAELNTLPYVARLDAPGAVAVTRKRGGTLVAALPTAATASVAALAEAAWPWARAATSVWATLLTNFNAVDHVATLLCNLGRFETPGTFRPWGDGATPGVVRVLESVDDEYRALRQALGVADGTPWKDYLVEQGMAPQGGTDTYETLHGSVLADIEFQGGPAALDHRFLTEDVPYSLVLASDIGAAVGVATPVVDGLVSIASAATGHDYRATGRTLATLGLAGRDAAGLRRAAEEGCW
jgi:opine dehydrogenase